MCILASIWIVCAIFCIPCYEYRKLVHYNFDIPELGFKQTVSYCIEEWPVIAEINGGVYYSLFSVFVQYFIPIVVLSGAYMRIYMRLKQRIVLSQASNVTGRAQTRSQSRDQKMKRTNCLLISIFLIFGVSWLPMNIFNFYVDWSGIVMNNEEIYIIYAICHMMGMSSGKYIFNRIHFHHIYTCHFKKKFKFSGELQSFHVILTLLCILTACSNPLLYGWLNDNFRKEFHEIFRFYKCNKNRRSNSALKLKALDVSYAGQRKILSEVGDIDKQSKLLLRPLGNTSDAMEMKSEYTL